MSLTPLGVTESLGVSMLLAAMGTTFGLVLLVRGFLSMAASSGGSRWLAWAAAGYLVISFIHFLVE